jgi:hypothetical protein
MIAVRDQGPADVLIAAGAGSDRQDQDNCCNVVEWERSQHDNVRTVVLTLARHAAHARRLQTRGREAAG